MAAYDSLKSLVQQAIRTNGNNEITGQVLQNVLMAMIDELGGENGYAGVATPSTNPGAPDGKVFYFATEAGTYTHFDGATLAKGIHLLVFNGVTWSHQTLYTIDSEVTSGSNNLITSGAVYTKIINAINALDATVSKSAGADGLSLSLTETDGKVTSISGSIAPQTYDAYGAASAAQIAASTDATNKVNAAKTQILGDAASDYNTLGKLEDKIQAEASRAAAAESALNTAKADKATTLAGYGINDAYTKTEVNGLVSTPHQNYVTVPTYASLPATGSADTIYRVSNYNGSTSQVDASVYSEYAWNGSGYTFLRVVSQIGEVFDITVYNSNTKYADLAAALGTNGANVPSSIRRGGMSVKFVQSSDNKYVQYRLMADEFTTDVTKWQGVDDKPTAGSKNLVESGGAFSKGIFFKGMSTNGEIAGASVGDIYYNTSDGTLRKVLENGYIVLPLIKDGIYISPFGMYKYNGATLELIKQFVIKIVGAFSSYRQYTGTYQIGDVFYNTSSNKFRFCYVLDDGSEYNQPGFVDLPVDNLSIVVNVSNGQYYYYDGHILIEFSYLQIGDILPTFNDVGNQIPSAKNIAAMLVRIVEVATSRDITLADGDVYFNPIQNKLLRRANGSDIELPLYTGALYVTAKNELYSFNGSTVSLLNTVVYVVGTFSSANSYTGTYQVGDIFYNISSKKFRKCVSTTESYGAAFIDLTINANSIIVDKGTRQCYLYDGQELVISKNEGDIASINFTLGSPISYDVLTGTYNQTTGDVQLVNNRLCTSKIMVFTGRHISCTLPSEMDYSFGFYFKWDAQGNFLGRTAVDAKTLTIESFNGYFAVNIKVSDTTSETIEEVKENLNVEITDGIIQNTEFNPLFGLAKYHQKAINEYANSIGALKNDNILCISFLTDLHMSDTYESFIGGIAGLMCQDFIDKTGIPDVCVLGGDNVDTNYDHPTTDEQFWFGMNNCNRLSAGSAMRRIALRGNHEYSSFISKLSYTRWAERFRLDGIERNPADPNGFYGMKDYENQKIRLIFLDTSLINYNGSVGDAQLSWLISTALDMTGKTDYSVVILSHEPLYDIQYQQYDWNSHPEYRKLISAFHRGTSVTINSQIVDFTNQGVIPTVCITGHTHSDLSYYNAEHDMDFLTICTMDSSTARDSRLRDNIGTVKECAFDTYFINSQTKTISIKRYGYGNDRTFTFD